MALELKETTQEDRKIHEDMMEKTLQNIRRQQQRLEETKKRKLEGLLLPPEKRTRQVEPMRKPYKSRQASRQAQLPYQRRNTQHKQ